METEQIQAVTAEERALASAEWKAYTSALKTNISDHRDYRRQYQALKNAQYYLARGKSILDLTESMRLGGLNDEQLPRLAICRADIREVSLNVNHWRGGSYDVQMEPNRRASYPAATFNFEREVFGPDLRRSGRFAAPVPVIPARLLPSANLRGYFILWEVEHWKAVPPKDPILLKRLGTDSNLFVVLAHWDLTKLERAVMRGAIA